MLRFTVHPLFPPVSLPDTLHCANISIIPDASCSKDYPGRLRKTMVCAGVEGGGTDSCEVRARRWRTGNKIASGWRKGHSALNALAQQRCKQ